MSHASIPAEQIAVVKIGTTIATEEPILVSSRTTPLEPVATVQIYTKGNWRQAPVYQREELKSGDRISGAALIIEPTGTNVIEPGWSAELTVRNHLILQRDVADNSPSTLSTPDSALTKPDPVLLEIFNNLLRAIAEDMGIAYCCH